MNLEEIWTLLEYHYWARDRMLESVDRLSPEQYTKDLGNSFGSVRDTVAHIYFAEWVWYSRWIGSPPSNFPDTEPFPDVATLRRVWRDQEAKVRLFVAGVGEHNFDRVFDYRLFNGQPAKSLFRHMLQHIVNHATYHRGQVTTMLRQLGVEPPKSQDLITFYRERRQPN